jgi:hypothetical protein
VPKRPAVIGQIVFLTERAGAAPRSLLPVTREVGVFRCRRQLNEESLGHVEFSGHGETVSAVTPRTAGHLPTFGFPDGLGQSHFPTPGSAAYTRTKYLVNGCRFSESSGRRSAHVGMIADDAFIGYVRHCCLSIRPRWRAFA